MEAAGIEPASRNVSTFTSTCVVGVHFELGRGDPNPTRSVRSKQGTFFSPGSSPRLARDDSELMTDFWGSPTKLLSPGYLFLGSQSIAIFDR